MTAGPGTVEQKVRVDLDPEVKVSVADLQAQWDALGRLARMIREVAGMLGEAGRHADLAGWRQLRDTLARPQGLSAAETGARLSEQLQSLYDLINGPNAAPTHPMMNLLAELEDEYKKAESAYKRLSQ
jgi:hypothetical protein